MYFTTSLQLKAAYRSRMELLYAELPHAASCICTAGQLYLKTRRCRLCWQVIVRRLALAEHALWHPQPAHKTFKIRAHRRCRFPHELQRRPQPANKHPENTPDRCNPTAEKRACDCAAQAGVVQVGSLLSPLAAHPPTNLPAAQEELSKWAQALQLPRWQAAHGRGSVPFQ
jgi:hypothetical protein